MKLAVRYFTKSKKGNTEKIAKFIEDKIFDRKGSFQEDKDELIKWCNENPQYADFIIWNGE